MPVESSQSIPFPFPFQDQPAHGLWLKYPQLSLKGLQHMQSRKYKCLFCFWVAVSGQGRGLVLPNGTHCIPLTEVTRTVSRCSFAEAEE